MSSALDFASVSPYTRAAAAEREAEHINGELGQRRGVGLVVGASGCRRPRDLREDVGLGNHRALSV